ncbi:hypothetical protein DFH27DRAFT_560768 [Peziza echinospora]|nr:hypothetical protein DFH27DRAFT_560768 [Peziza echinospora]
MSYDDDQLCFFVVCCLLFVGFGHGTLRAYKKRAAAGARVWNINGIDIYNLLIMSYMFFFPFVPFFPWIGL